MALERAELNHKCNIAVLKLNQLRAENELGSQNTGAWEQLCQFAQGTVCVTLYLFLMAVALIGMRAALERFACWLGL